MRYPRVLLKMSGEALSGDPESPKFPYCPDTVMRLGDEIRQVHEREPTLEIVIVPGGGNIFRGANGASKGMDRVAADQFGMLATVQNSIVMKDILERVYRIPTRISTRIHCNAVAEPYNKGRAVRHLEKGRVLILAGGTGNPFCTTDFAAALGAAELGCKLIAKATNTDGLYTRDPRKHADAALIPFATYERVIQEKLEVMDGEAFQTCSKQHIPIRIFSLKESGNIAKALLGGEIGSLVADEPLAA